MDRIVDYLSSYATELSYDMLPAEVVQQAKGLIVDTVGCAIGGYDSQPSRVAMEMAEMVSTSQPATVLVSGQRTTPDLAAFANGTMIRYLDFNDGYTSVDSGHPSDAIAAVLSPAEIAHADGKAFITATVLAYETFCRLCDAVGVRNRGYDHVTLGVIASGMGAAKAMGLSREQTAQTLNLCVAPNISLHQTRIGELSMWKACAFANASRNAVFAAQLAQRGLTGPEDIFEGRQGFFPVIAGGPFELAPFGGTGTPFKVIETSIKRYPLGLYSQTVVQAALEAREKVPSVEDIAEVHVSTLETAVRIMAGDEEKWRPTTRETADHSMPYTVAVALMEGSLEVRHFDDEYLRNPRLLELVQKVKVSVSEEANRRAPEAMLSTVEVVTKSGERISSPPVPYHLGHWKNPMNRDQIDAKFRSMSLDVLGAARTDALLERLWGLEQVGDIGEVVAAASA